jgi:bacterioferritin
VANEYIYPKKERYMDQKTFASELPYPTLSLSKNLSESKILMPSYGGLCSEMTAVMTYTYQHFVSDHPIADLLKGVSVVEMKHFELLGEAITALGGYPVIAGRTYWSANNVNYTPDPKKFLKQNVIAEETAILNYERAILNLSQDSLKQLLERIIIDEEIHIKLFKDCLASL